MSDRLIRRDTPLIAGMKVDVRVEMIYTLDVEEWLDGEPSVTVDVIEGELKKAHRDIIAAMTHYGYGGEYADDAWYMTLPTDVICTCRRSPHEGDCPARWEGKVIDARFETPYEQEQRERGASHHYRVSEPPLYVEPGRMTA